MTFKQQPSAHLFGPNGEESPILVGIRMPKGGIDVWCEYCRKRHHHGGDPGHRVAHCVNPASPYLRTGYVLLVME